MVNRGNAGLNARQKRALSKLKGHAYNAQLANFLSQKSMAMRNRQPNYGPGFGRGVSYSAANDIGRWGQTPASSNRIAPRGYGYYDAFAHHASTAMTHNSIGPATPLTADTVVSTIETQPSILCNTFEAGSFLLMIQPNCGSVQAKIFSCSTTTTDDDGNTVDAYVKATDPIQEYPYASTQLPETPSVSTGTGPMNMIPARCSIRMTNKSQENSIGGQLRVLKATTGMALDKDFTKNIDLCVLMNQIRTMRRSQLITRAQLADCFQTNANIVDASRATWFKPFNEVYNCKQLPWTRNEGWDQSSTVNIDSFTDTLYNPSFTPIVVLVEPYQASIGSGAKGNEYSLSIVSQFLCHYKQGSALANMAISAPVGPSVLDAHSHAEEEAPPARPLDLNGATEWVAENADGIASGVRTAMNIGRHIGRAFDMPWPAPGRHQHLEFR